MLGCIAVHALAVGCAAESLETVDAVEQSGALTFEEFMERVEVEDFEGGVYILDGDVPIDTYKRLMEVFESLNSDSALTVATSGGQDLVWEPATARALTYCVSDSFGGLLPEVIEAMDAAAAAWEEVADVDFVHVASEDSRCDGNNDNVVFDVRPVRGAGYLARAFFPYQRRSTRNVLIDSSAYSVRAPLSLAGILRHELGHALGFRHEHTRISRNPCYEDSQWRGVTEYDSGSVMHYPQCGGTGSDLRLTALDADGAASIYGSPQAPGQTTPEPEPAIDPGTERSGQAEGSLGSGQEQRYQALSVKPGTLFEVSISGDGDADLYVRFGAEPDTRRYDCRPYGPDSNERCALTVPETETEAFMMVRGYEPTLFTLAVDWIEP